MKRFIHLTANEMAEVIDKAVLWEERHRGHVKELMASETSQFEPSGSDLLRPELWKPGHWRWLFDYKSDQFD